MRPTHPVQQSRQFSKGVDGAGHPLGVGPYDYKWKLGRHEVKVGVVRDEGKLLGLTKRDGGGPHVVDPLALRRP